MKKKKYNYKPVCEQNEFNNSYRITCGYKCIKLVFEVFEEKDRDFLMSATSDKDFVWILRLLNLGYKIGGNAVLSPLNIHCQDTFLDQEDINGTVLLIGE